MDSNSYRRIPDHESIEQRIKFVSKYLKSNEETRSLFGLPSLENLLVTHSVSGKVFTTEKECQELEWIELLLKFIEQKQEPAEVCFRILNKLLIITANHQEIHKIIQSKFIQRIIEVIISNPHSVQSFETLLTCLKSYSGTSGIYKNKIYDFCTSIINTSNIELIKWSGKCLHSLQQTRGGSVSGTVYKNNWADFHEKLLNTIDHEFSTLFNTNDSKTGKSERLKLPESSEKSNFSNLCTILEVGLLQSFPAAKTIQMNRIISLVDKGIALNQIEMNKKSGDTKLPFNHHAQIQMRFLSILKSLILAVGGNIQMMSKDVTDVLWKCLKSTNIPFDELRGESNASLRCLIYQVLIVFMRASPNNFFIYKNMENFLKEAFIDITPIYNEIALTLPQQVNEKSRNKKKKENTLNVRKLGENANEKCLVLHQRLCAKSLEFLRHLLVYNGAAMKPILLKILQDKILKITFQFLSNDLWEFQLYSSTLCRLNMMELIYLILSHPPIRNVTPMNFYLEIIRKFKNNDNNVNIRNRATELIRNSEGLIHSRKDPIHFPVDLKEFRDSWLFNEKTVKAFEKLDEERSMWVAASPNLETNGQKSTKSINEKDLSEDEINQEQEVEEAQEEEDQTNLKRTVSCNEEINDEETSTQAKKVKTTDHVVKMKEVEEDDELVDSYFNDFHCE